VYSPVNPRAETDSQAFWRYEAYRVATTVGEACDKKGSSNFEIDIKKSALVFTNAKGSFPLPPTATKLED
jgi:endo-1,4-beta-D-glucanase Y